MTGTAPLALTYRPHRLDDLVGQPAVQIILRRMLTIGQIPNAMLFSGCRGTGKTTTARILAAALNCPADNKPCGTCPSCVAVADGSSMDVIEIDAASNGLVADIRELRQQVMYRNVGAYRVVILDEAQSISPAGFNALLKLLEEPPPNTLFCLLTTEPGKILRTVASRCMPFTFKRLTIADIAGRLAHIAHSEGHPVEHDLLITIAQRADGALRDAIMLLDQVIRIGLTTAEQYQRLLGHHDAAPVLLDQLVNGDLPGAFTTLDDAFTRVADAATIVADVISCLRDILILRAGGDLTRTGTSLAAVQNLAPILESTTVVAALKILWQVKTQLRLDDTRSTLELALVMLAEVFGTQNTAAPARRVSLAEMGRS